MREIEEKLQQLPSFNPQEAFISSLGSRLVEKHIASQKQRNTPWSNFSFVFGGIVAVLFIVSSGLLLGYPDFEVEKNNEVEIATSTISEDDVFLQEKGGNDATSPSTNNQGIFDLETRESIQEENSDSVSITGIMFLSSLSSDLYQLESEGKVIYFIERKDKSLDKYLHKEVVIEGILQNKYNDTIQLLEIVNIQLQ